MPLSVMEYSKVVWERGPSPQYVGEAKIRVERDGNLWRITIAHGSLPSTARDLIEAAISDLWRLHQIDEGAKIWAWCEGWRVPEEVDIHVEDPPDSRWFLALWEKTEKALGSETLTEICLGKEE